jgi:hypothetical protein
MQKTLIIVGLIVIVVGLLWPWLGRLPLGRLPGDIIINKPHLKVYIPITSMIVISIIASVLVWIFRIFRR